MLRNDILFQQVKHQILRYEAWQNLLHGQLVNSKP